MIVESLAAGLASGVALEKGLAPNTDRDDNMVISKKIRIKYSQGLGPQAPIPSISEQPTFLPPSPVVELSDSNDELSLHRNIFYLLISYTQAQPVEPPSSFNPAALEVIPQETFLPRSPIREVAPKPRDDQSSS